MLHINDLYFELLFQTESDVLDRVFFGRKLESIFSILRKCICDQKARFEKSSKEL
jgi:hypothetical protein